MFEFGYFWVFWCIGDVEVVKEEDPLWNLEIFKVQNWELLNEFECFHHKLNSVFIFSSAFKNVDELSQQVRPEFS